MVQPSEAGGGLGERARRARLHPIRGPAGPVACAGIKLGAAVLPNTRAGPLGPRPLCTSCLAISKGRRPLCCISFKQGPQALVYYYQGALPSARGPLITKGKGAKPPVYKGPSRARKP